MRSGPELPHWKAEIRYLDGTSLPEWQIEYSRAEADRPPTVKCYLECEDDKEFAIWVRRPRCTIGETNFVIDPTVDNVKLSGVVFSPTDLECPSESRRPWYIFDRIYQHSENGDTMVSKLKFGKLVRVETDSITESDRTIAERLGEICVSLYTGVEVGPYTKSKVTISGNLHSTVSEKAKKGCAAPKVIAWLLAETWQALIAHTVQTATSRPITGSEGFATSVAFNRHTPKCPQFTFIFRYRSRNMLRALRVIKPPPQADASPSSTPQEPQGRKRKSGDVRCTNDKSEVKAEQDEDIKPAIGEEAYNDHEDEDGIEFLDESRPKKRKSSVASAKVTEVVDSDDGDL